MADKSDRLVYSTDRGRLCADCQQAMDDCNCTHTAASRILGDGNVKIRRETKGRKGKGVTLVEGLALNQLELNTLAKELKAKCSSGGAVKDGIIEIQGDHRPLIQSLLSAKGIKSVRAGS
jgi:translation initiation factor 1